MLLINALHFLEREAEGDAQEAVPRALRASSQLPSASAQRCAAFERTKACCGEGSATGEWISDKHEGKLRLFGVKTSGRRVCLLDGFRRIGGIFICFLSLTVHLFTWLRSAFCIARPPKIHYIPVVFVLEKKLGEKCEHFFKSPRSLASETAGPCREDFPSFPLFRLTRPSSSDLSAKCATI